MKDVIVEIVKKIVKYTIEGFVVAIVAFYIPKKVMTVKEVSIIGITAATVLAILDMFAPTIGLFTRQGIGFGIGAAQVGYAGKLVPAV